MLWKVTSRADHELLGYAGLWPFFDEAKPQLLYAFHPDFTGSGYATESSQRIAAYAFEQLGFSDLVASMDADNHASAKVCERLGMTFKGAREIDGAHVTFYVLTHSPSG